MTQPKAHLIQVIRTTLETRGSGNDVRRVEQYWHEEGHLLAENDPDQGKVEKERIIQLKAKIKELEDESVSLHEANDALVLELRQPTPENSETSSAHRDV